MKILSASVVKTAAMSVGFQACGIAAVSVLSQFGEQLQLWLRDHCHGNMQYMERYCDMRADPTLLEPGANSVISVMLGYNPSQLMSGRGKVARFAYSTDYHIVLKQMLFAMMAKIKETYPDFEGRACVDTAPISDKLWASRAGLGWIGKNSLLVTSQYGSWINLGEIVTSWYVDQYDKPVENLCGNCCRCVVSCPNKAIEKVGEIYRLNASHCAAYHTIESHSEQLPLSLHQSGFLFGCDVCQQVCPFNIVAPSTRDVPAERIDQLQQLVVCDEPFFRKIAKRSSLSRIKFWQLLRNRNRL